MRSGGQYVAMALPMIHARGTGPQKRLSLELSRLSPMRKYSPGGMTIASRLQTGSLQELANGSAAGRPLRMTCPLRIAMRSPGRPTRRLMNVLDARWPVGWAHERVFAGP